MGIERNTNLNSETRELMQCCIYFLGVGVEGMCNGRISLPWETQELNSFHKVARTFENLFTGSTVMAPVGKQLFPADTGGELWGDDRPHILGHHCF